MIQWKWKWQEQQYDSLPPPPHLPPSQPQAYWQHLIQNLCVFLLPEEEEGGGSGAADTQHKCEWSSMITCYLRGRLHTLSYNKNRKKKTGNLCLWLGLLRNYLQLLRGTVVPNISLEKNQSSVWDGPSQEVLGVSQSHCTTVLHWSWSWAQKSHAHLAQHVCDWMVSLAAAPAVEVDHRSIKRWTDWVVMGTQTHIDPVCYSLKDVLFWNTDGFSLIEEVNEAGSPLIHGPVRGHGPGVGDTCSYITEIIIFF